MLVPQVPASSIENPGRCRWVPRAGAFALSQTQPLYIGRHASQAWFVDAHMFDLAVYDRGLDPGEVTQLYQRGIQGLANNVAAGRMAYYPMENDFDDQSGNGNHGAPQGDAQTVSRSRGSRRYICFGDPAVDSDTKKFGHYSPFMPSAIHDALGINQAPKRR